MVSLGLRTLLRCGAIITVIFSTLLINQLTLYIDESTDFGDVVGPSEEVETAVRELVVNKSCGIDGIYAEHVYVIFFSCFDSFARPLYV